MYIFGDNLPLAITAKHGSCHSNILHILDMFPLQSGKNSNFQTFSSHPFPFQSTFDLANPMLVPEHLISLSAQGLSTEFLTHIKILTYCSRNLMGYAGILKGKG